MKSIQKPTKGIIATIVF